MEKYRIYELAKDLNTTSKRLIEKLSEINIIVKNHMSYINDEEIKALYKHIGVVSHDQESQDDDSRKKPPAPAPAPAPRKTVAEQGKMKESAQKSSHHIIRTREIFVDEKPSDKYKRESDARKEDGQGHGKGDYKKGKKYGGIKVNVASSGLRTGFVRDTGPVVKKKEQPAKIDKSQQKAQDEDQGILRHKTAEEVLGDARDKTVEETDRIDRDHGTVDVKRETREITRGETEKDGTKEELIDKRALKEIKKEAEKETKRETQKETKTVEKESEKVKGKEKGKERSSHVDRKREYPDKDGTGAHGMQDKTRKYEHKAIKDKERGAVHTERTKEYKHETRKREPQKQDIFEIPKPVIDIDYEETKSIDYRNKDYDKDKKREQKREVPKIPPVANIKKKFKTHEILIDKKKDISELITEDIVLDDSYDEQKLKKAAKPKIPDKKKEVKKDAAFVEHQKPAIISVKVPEKIIVKDLAEILKKSSADVIKKLMNLGLMVTVNQEIDFDTAAVIADEFGIKAEKEIIINEEDILFDDEEDNEEDLVPRPPVVVVMGHVDHGKTSLLDSIRKTNVIESEEGGITQHIGAYTVNINNRKITFLDTPGHEAFTAMRARGAQVTDIAILVVAADDGVMPQTIEAINHAKAAGVSIIVAVNKIDKPGANPEKVKQQLTEYGLVPEEWGGDIVVVPVSALKHENIDLLLEMVLLTADLLELKASLKKQAKGTIIEAKLDKNRGPVVTLLIQRGTLNVGDTVISGTTLSRVRAMSDDKGQSIKSAGPSTPVEVLGFSEVPETGEIFYAVKDEKVAKSLIEKRKEVFREELMKKTTSRVSLEDLFSQIQEGKVKELNMIIKADVLGSVEALEQAVEKLSNDDVKINIIHGGVGGITETDVRLADVSNAIIIGFNVRPVPNVLEIAKNSNVDIRLYRIIYDVIEDIQAAMKGMLDPKVEEVILGHAEIRQLFKSSGVGTIGGSYILDGKITRNSDVRVLRDSVLVYEGKLASLKRFKEDVREVTQGYECGILIDNFNDIKEGDIIEAYTMKEVQQ